jgi:hypothetical protein
MGHDTSFLLRHYKLQTYETCTSYILTLYATQLMKNGLNVNVFRKFKINSLKFLKHMNKYYSCRQL